MKMFMGNRKRSTLIASACVLVLATACGTRFGETTTTAGRMTRVVGLRSAGPADARGDRRHGGRGQHPRLARLRRGRQHRPSRRLGVVLRGGDGCQANVKYFATSDEAVQLMKTGEYDVVSASGDASLRLIAAGDVEPVNVDLIPAYADVYDYLKERDWNSVDGQMYGVPHGYGANLLMWRTDEVKPAPTSWSVVFDDARRLRRQGDGVRLADLHRRRRDVPDGDPARPGHRAPVRARRGPARRRCRPAQGAAGERGRVLVGLPQGGPGLHHGRLRGRHDLAGDRQRRAGRGRAGRRDPPGGGRHRLVRHLDGGRRRGQQELRLRVDEPHHQSRSQRRGRGVLRRGAVEPEGVRHRLQGALRDVPRR